MSEPKLPFWIPKLQSFQDRRALPATEAVELLLQDPIVGHLHLFGRGAAYATANLQRLYSEDGRIAFPDFPFDWGEIAKAVRVVITHSFGRPSPHDAEESHRLLPLDRDDAIDILLEQGPSVCQRVLDRLEPQHYSDLGDDYELWELVFDAIAKNDSSVDEVLWSLLVNSLEGPRLDSFGVRSLEELGALLCRNDFDTVPFPPFSLLGRLIEIPTNQQRIQATYVSKQLLLADATVLKRMYPQATLRAIAQEVEGKRKAIKTLRKSIVGNLASTALSILNQIAPQPRLPSLVKQKLQSAWLDHCKWPGINLQETEFSHCDLYGAKWNKGQVIDCSLFKSCLDQTSLEGCVLKANVAIACGFRGASFASMNGYRDVCRRCDFSDSIWTEARVQFNLFRRCCFKNVSFKDASFQNCQFHKCDFTNAEWIGLDASGSTIDDCQLQGLKLSQSNFSRATLDGDFEDMELDYVNFENARLANSMWTGSKASHLNLSNANLAYCKLAEIEWNACDLRNANLAGVIFHFGSTRCGLVGSPYPSHGTRTGFYTEPSEELYYREPELVRRAALVDCDLRGASLDGVNLYLVDLRGSHLDPGQRKHAIATGAILED